MLGGLSYHSIAAAVRRALTQIGIASDPTIGAVVVGHVAGTTDDKLQVISNEATVNGLAVARFSADSAASVFRMLKSRAAAKGAHGLVQLGEALAVHNYYGSDGVNWQLAGQIIVVVADTPGVNDMPGEFRISTTPNGSTSPVERLRIGSDGLVTLHAGQLAFPASQNASAGANTLDDYEEGTFTPTNGGTAAYSSRFGRYTKIGNRVLFNIMIVVATIGTGNQANISGLPFTAKASGGTHSIDVGYWTGLALSIVAIGGAVGEGLSMVTVNSATAAATTLATNAIIGNGTSLACGGHYDVD